VFVRLTSRKWPAETLCRFLGGWRALHGTALYVSALIARVHREAVLSSGGAFDVYRSAAELSEIIAEDVGVDDCPHSERFAQFANQLVGDDRWASSRYSSPACEEFREYVKYQRLRAPVEEGILTTAASELWNTGEYTFFASMVVHWMTQILGHPIDAAKESAAYVTVHAGDTELGHFLHALEAWSLYCKSLDMECDPSKACKSVETYLSRLIPAFKSLEQVFRE
jgi:hypothetical protein